MIITKFSHACLVIEKNNQTIVIDPGNFTDDLVIPNNVAAIVITHEHPDHCDQQLIEQIKEANPACKLIAHQSVTTQFQKIATQDVAAGDQLAVGGFGLRFYGGQHATIHSSLPTPANLGVLIDKQVYYPGDSFFIPALFYKRKRVSRSIFYSAWINNDNVVL